jgi:Mn2+/Fe2+ NRAMP family transporter
MVAGRVLIHAENEGGFRMSAITQIDTEKAYQKYAWVILFALGVLLTLNNLILLVAGIAQASAIGYLGFSLLATVIAFFNYRNRERWAWYAMWIFPAVLVLTAIRLFSENEDRGLALMFTAFAALSLLGLLLPSRMFFPKKTI